MNGETFEANHRCEGSLNARCRVLKNITRHGVTNLGWHLYYIYDDFEYDSIYPLKVAEIKFCPFCGKELE